MNMYDELSALSTEDQDISGRKIENQDPWRLVIWFKWLLLNKA